jgi:hypothetical protein
MRSSSPSSRRSTRSLCLAALERWPALLLQQRGPNDDDHLFLFVKVVEVGMGRRYQKEIFVVKKTTPETVQAPAKATCAMRGTTQSPVLYMSGSSSPSQLLDRGLYTTYWMPLTDPPIDPTWYHKVSLSERKRPTAVSPPPPPPTTGRAGPVGSPWARR